MTIKKCFIIKGPFYLPGGCFAWPFDEKKAQNLLKEAFYSSSFKHFKKSSFSATVLTERTQSWGLSDFVFSAYSFLYHDKESSHSGWRDLLCILLNETLSDKTYVFVLNNSFPINEDRKGVVIAGWVVLGTHSLGRASKKSFQNFFFFFQV